MRKAVSRGEDMNPLAGRRIAFRSSLLTRCAGTNLNRRCLKAPQEPRRNRVWTVLRSRSRQTVAWLLVVVEEVSFLFKVFYMSGKDICILLLSIDVCPDVSRWSCCHVTTSNAITTHSAERGMARRRKRTCCVDANVRVTPLWFLFRAAVS